MQEAAERGGSGAQFAGALSFNLALLGGRQARFQLPGMPFLGLGARHWVGSEGDPVSRTRWSALAWPSPRVLGWPAFSSPAFHRGPPDEKPLRTTPASRSTAGQPAIIPSTMGALVERERVPASKNADQRKPPDVSVQGARVSHTGPSQAIVGMVPEWTVGRFALSALTRSKTPSLIPFLMSPLLDTALAARRRVGGRPPTVSGAPPKGRSESLQQNAGASDASVSGSTLGPTGGRQLDVRHDSLIHARTVMPGWSPLVFLAGQGTPSFPVQRAAGSSTPPRASNHPLLPQLGSRSDAVVSSTWPRSHPKRESGGRASSASSSLSGLGAPWPSSGARPDSLDGRAPGPFATTPLRGMGAIASALERVVERKVVVEVERKRDEMSAEAPQHTDENRPAVDVISDEVVRRLMHKMRVLSQEERFRLGRLR